jgi:hypothetical protein
MKKLWLIAFTALLSVTVFSEEPLMRNSFELMLNVDSESIYKAQIEESTYVLKGNTVQIYPGEMIFLEAEEDNGVIKSVKAVKENIYPEKTIEITFGQQSEEKIHKAMMLSVKNPFKQQLEYKAYIFLMKYNKWVLTTTKAVKPGLVSYEIWPDIIVTMILNEWKLKEKTKTREESN